jgi:hypothetical protein
MMRLKPSEDISALLQDDALGMAKKCTTSDGLAAARSRVSSPGDWLLLFRYPYNPALAGGDGHSFACGDCFAVVF